MNEYRIKFVTKDGQLVQNRLGNKSCWQTWNGQFNTEIAKFFLAKDCQEKGCKLISYTHDENGINAIVEWLK